MNPLYLSRVVLSDFRTYGPASAVDVAAEAGLTILCGMNGLGKTGFFEGIEWALTGDIRRLHDRIGSVEAVLGRWHRQGQYGVELRFNNNESVRRDESHAPDAASIISLLKAETWQPPIHDIATYLRLTHLLSQSSQQRFVDVGSERQWALLKGAAGVDRVDRLRNLLTTKRVRNAFRRQIEILTTDRQALEAKLVRLRELQIRQHDLRALAAAGAAVSPADGLALAEELIRELPSESVKPTRNPTGQTNAEVLARLVKAVDRHQTEIQQQIDQMTTHAELMSRWLELEKSQTVLTARSKVAAERVEQLETEVKLRGGQMDLIRTELRQLELTMTDLENKAEALRKMAEARRRTEALRSQMSTTEKELVAATEALALANTDLVTVRKQLTRWQELTAKLREIQKAEGVLEEVNLLFGRAAEAKNAAVKAEDEKRQVEGTLTQLKKETEELQRVAQLGQATLQSLRTQLAADQATVGVLAKAVSEIATHLGEADTICPVCSHEHSAGELIRAARTSMARLHAGNPATAERLSQGERDLQVTMGQLETLAQKKAAETARLAPLDQVIQTAKKLQAELEAHSALAGLLPIERADFPQRRTEELRVRRESIANDLAAEPNADTTEEKRQTAERTIDGLKVQTKALQIRQAENQRELDTQHAILESHREYLIPELETISAIDSARAGALVAAEDHKKRILEVKGRLAPLEQAAEAQANDLSKGRAEVALVGAEIKREQNARTEIISTWERLGFQGSPDPTSWARRLQSLTEAQSLNARIKEKTQALVRGLELWDRNAELHKLEAELAEIFKFAAARNIAPTEAALAAAVEKAGTAVKNAELAFDHATATANSLTQAAAKYSSAALQPLNDRIDSFHTVISPFGFKYQVKAKVRPTVTDLRQSMAVESAGDAKPVECDPSAHLSEGQSAALGLSILFAAATEYPWSRWPALLLDDPLQNTDLIHASAFIDVIRGMILDRGFQIILSTHDMDEADFIGRKCLRGGVKVSRTELVSMGPNGVRLRNRPFAGQTFAVGSPVAIPPAWTGEANGIATV